MHYKTFVTEIALEAGELIRKNFTTGMKKEWKYGYSATTKTDHIINKLVIDRIKEKFPDHNVLGEEKDSLSGTSNFVWVCDPVDGTKPFSHAIPTSVFSLALVESGISMVGIVYDPFLDRMFFAEKNKGAFLNERKITVSPENQIKHSLFGVCYGWKEEPFDFSSLAREIKHQSGEVIDVGSITYMGALVAAGELAGTFFQGTKPHDTAALKVIVEEAGGKVTDLFGNDQRYDRDIQGHICSNGVLHDESVRLFKENIIKISS